jgi:hypothetical protein
MAQAIFDIAEELDLYFRTARAQDKTFEFEDTAGDPYTISGITWNLNFKTYAGASTNVLQLTSGSGLTISTSSIVIALTEVQSDLPRDMYYWELYDATNKETWLCGNAHFTKGKPANLSDSTSVTINLIPDIVRITITGGGNGDVSATWRHCGNVDLSGNTYPTTGGTGTSGAIQAYNTFRVTVEGTIGGTLIPVDAILFSLVDTPGQTTSNWRVINA